MKNHVTVAMLGMLATAGTLQAQEHRELSAHEHGVGMLTIALDGNDLALELDAPGADIVGFEHAATSDADKAAIAAALETLEKPALLFVLPEEAGCSVVDAHAELVGSDDEHEHEHEHDEHAHDDDHAHADEHKDHAHDAHDHDEGHKDAHDGHGHAEGHDHDDHDDHADEGAHSEFRAAYAFTCSSPEALTGMSFPYFQLFPNARELEVQAAMPGGAFAAEVERDDAVLDLSASR